MPRGPHQSRAKRRARPQATTLPCAPAATPAAGATLIRWLLPCVVLAVTFVAFVPALTADFVSWDDDRNFLENPHYRGLSVKHLAWMFTTTKMGHYQPLSWVTLGLDYSLWRMKASGYHLTNILFHCATTLALYFLALRLLALARPAAVTASPRTARLCAALAALLFAVHPLRAESVAWVTERRDVLSGLFFVLALGAYLRSCSGRRAPALHRGWYLASVALLTLSLLSKAWGMTFVAVLIILDAYPLRRLGRFPRGGFNPSTLHVWLQKIPFLVLAVMAAAKAAQAQAGQFETMKTLAQHGLIPRLGQAFYGLDFYASKTLLPVGLGPIYEIPHNFTGLEPRILLSAAAVLTVTLALLLLAKRWPAGLAAWAYYVVVVSPVLGLVQSGPQLVKECYSYLCCMPWGLLLAGGLWRLWEPRPAREAPAERWRAGLSPDPERRRAALALLASILAAGLLVLLGALTWRQAAFWKNSRTLWTRALVVQPDSYNANNNLAVLLREDGRITEAIHCYRKAIAARPTEATAYFNLANARKQLARAAQADGDGNAALNHYRAAARNYQQAIELNPLQASFHFNLAQTLANKLNRSEQALEHYREALRLKGLPRAPASRVKRSTLRYCIAFELNKLGRTDQAREHLDACLRLNPNHPQARKLLRRLEPTSPNNPAR